MTALAAEAKGIFVGEQANSMAVRLLPATPETQAAVDKAAEGVGKAIEASCAIGEGDDRLEVLAATIKSALHMAEGVCG
jgi:hypothetical protein